MASNAGRIAAILILAAGTAGVARAQQFSADIISKDAAGQGRETGPVHISVAGTKMRVESPRGAAIFDTDAGTMTVLQAQQKTAMVMSTSMGPAGQQMAFTHYLHNLDPADACPGWAAMARDMGKGEGSGSCSRVGPETVNGRSTMKYNYTNARGEAGTVWIDLKLHFPLKVDATHGAMELQNVQDGAPPASSFEVPADYKRMDMSQMMNQYRQPHGAAGAPPPQ